MISVWSARFQMSAVGITENIRGDSKKFEVWYNGREEVYIIQVRNPQSPRSSATGLEKPIRAFLLMALP